MKNIVNTITESVSPSDIYIILGKGDRGTWPAHTCRVVVISNPSKSLLNALNKKGNKTTREMELIDSLVIVFLRKIQECMTGEEKKFCLTIASVFSDGAI